MSNAKFTFEEIPSLDGKVAIVTGGNTVRKGHGIGLETIREIASHGAKKVYMGARSAEKAKKAIEDLKTQSGDKVASVVEHVSLDLADLASVREFVKIIKSKEEKVDILVCNAGVMASPYEITKDGFEMQFQTNHLGHFLLVQDILPLLKVSGQTSGHPARIVNLSSIGHKMISFNPFLEPKFDSKEDINRKMSYIPLIGTYMRYSQAKLAALLFAREFNKRNGPEVRATAVHPGVVATELYRYTPLAPIAKYTMITSRDGALASLYAATSTDIETTNTWDVYRGTYGLPNRDSAYSKDPKLSKSLWDLCEALVRT